MLSTIYDDSDNGSSHDDVAWDNWNAIDGHSKANHWCNYQPESVVAKPGKVQCNLLTKIHPTPDTIQSQWQMMHVSYEVSKHATKSKNTGSQSTSCLPYDVRYEAAFVLTFETYINTQLLDWVLAMVCNWQTTPGTASNYFFCTNWSH